MALSLNDVAKHKEKKTPVSELEATQLESLESDVERESTSVASQVIEKTLRPWERHDQSSLKTRTLRAQEAVKRAREIVYRNEGMSEELKLEAQLSFENESSALARPLTNKYEAFTKLSESASDSKDFRIKTRRRSVIQILRRLIH